MKKANEEKMKQHLNLDTEKMQKILDIKLKVFKGELAPDDAKKLVNETFEYVTADEFAFGEQEILSYGITDEVMLDGMDDIIDIFRDVLVSKPLNLPDGHPIKTYDNEASAIDRVLFEMEKLLQQKFIKNQWLELYEKLNQINIHFSRKQNQLFPALERKGFDRPSKVMWTFDNNVRDNIKEAFLLLKADNDKAFCDAQANVIHLVRDILEKERDVLYPTSLELIPDEEFAAMRISDDEIGYCLIDTPPAYKPELITPKEEKSAAATNDNFMQDLDQLLQKHGVANMHQADKELDISMGKLTLEQINLIFKHLQVDLSYVDENEIVKFYSDTKHRVFPRSAGVIGREVQNCHPRESVATVERIIDAFRKGEKDEAEFWLEMDDKFIYIIYNAVRDDKGNFRGVLEMMQDVTHIRSLKGSQKLLTWDTPSEKETPKVKEAKPVTEELQGEVTSKTIIAPLLKKYPFLKEFLINLNPKYKQLNNPLVFKVMGNIATIEMIAKRGGYTTEELLKYLNDEIEKQNINK